MQHDLPDDQILGHTTNPWRTHSSLYGICANLAFLLQMEPKNFGEAETDEIVFLLCKKSLINLEETEYGT